MIIVRILSLGFQSLDSSCNYFECKSPKLGAKKKNSAYAFFGEKVQNLISILNFNSRAKSTCKLQKK